MNANREELVLAQKLFNLDITSCPELAFIGDELLELSVIYDFYIEIRDSIKTWGQTLFAERKRPRTSPRTWRCWLRDQLRRGPGLPRDGQDLLRARADRRVGLFRRV